MQISVLIPPERACKRSRISASLKGRNGDIDIQVVSLPVRIAPTARPIPVQPWFLHTIFMSLIGGVLPLGAVFTEMFFIMSSIWQHQFYYLFGFLMLVAQIPFAKFRLFNRLIGLKINHFGMWHGLRK